MTYLSSLLLCTLLTGFCATGEVVETTVAANEIADAQTAIVEVSGDERIEEIYPLDMNGSVKAANINGSVKVTTWDSPQVRLIAVKTADNPEDLKLVEVKVESTGNSFSVKADYDQNKDNWETKSRKVQNLKVEFELTVPRTARLDSIATVNGDVSVEGADSYTKASTVNGTVKATKLGGEATLTTVNGTVEAAFDQLAQGADIKLTTVNGKVNLTLPSDANAEVRASSLSGNIENDFGLPVRKGEFVGRDMHGRIGAGGVTIKLSSVSGGLSVKRKNDGLPVNPSENLLNMKGDSDDSY